MVGQDFVSARGEELAAIATATFATSHTAVAVVRPGNTAEVQACVDIANRRRIPLYPVSGGKNWGLGSRVPPRSGCAVLDLSRLNRIVEYNERLAYLTVEAGVTFRQAADFLEAKQSPLWLAPTGGPADGSIVGNVVERGHGNGPYGVRLDHVCDLEVVLPSGAVIRTGFGRFTGATAAAVDRWGVGPSLDGLFTQSNLGIVTRLTAWLMPVPRVHQFIEFSVRDYQQLAAALDAVQPLILHDVVRPNSIVFWNSYKLLSRAGRYPFDLTKGETPLRLAARKGAEPWYAQGALYAPSEDVARAEAEVVRHALESRVDGLTFRKSGDEERASLGQPGEGNLRSMYWRKRVPYPEDLNPERDRCGVIWICPAFPFDGAEIARAVEAAERTIAQHGFEPNVGMTCVSARGVHAFFMITYDRDIPGEDDRAMRCHDDVLEDFCRAGHFPYRLGIQSLESMPPANDDRAAFLQAVKRALDPHDILAPGRYDDRRDWKDST